MLLIRQQCTAEMVDVYSCLPEKLRKTCLGEDSALYEYKNLISFTTKTILSILKKNKHYFADRVFSRLRTKMFYLFPC